MKTLDNKKVFVSTPETSKAVQEKAFKLGYEWYMYEQQVSHTNHPFIFFFDTPTLGYCKDFNQFANSDLEEITAAEILAMDIPEPEETFKPFRKVLVMDKEVKRWVPDFYREKADYGHITVGGQHWDYCIDYETNKHFAFTTGKP